MTATSLGKRERTRDSLLVALQELILEPNGDGVTVPRIVARAGVSQGTFYNYFTDLPDAIDAVGNLALGEHARVLSRVTESITDPVEVIARSATQTLLLFAQRADIGVLLFDSGLPVHRLVSGVREHFRADLLRARASGVVRVPELVVAESVYAGALLGSCLDLHRKRLAVDDIPAIARHLLRILGVEDAAAQRLSDRPQEFVPWCSLPLSSIAEERS